MLNLIKSSLRTVKSTIVITILICVVIFMVNNREKITVHFFPFPFDLETRLFFVMLLCFTIGLVCGFLLFSKNMLGKTISNWQEQRKLKNEIKILQKS